MANRTYKKYMKKNVKQQEYPMAKIIKIFLISFFSMLLVFTFFIKMLPSADTSIGDYQPDNEIENIDEIKKIVDNRLEKIQEEDIGRNFTEIIKTASDTENDIDKSKLSKSNKLETTETEINEQPSAEPIYKVFVGSYTSSEQAKVAKEIIQESGKGFNPIVKCIGSNNYTLQVGIFKNKQSAESLLYTVQQNHLPGRIVQEY